MGGRRRGEKRGCSEQANDGNDHMAGIGADGRA
jgi:hypothetical protein